MPPKVKVRKSDIVDAAVALVRRQGEGAVNARSVAAELRCSTQPVFSHFSTMEELRLAVREAADARYQSCLKAEMAAGRYPPYKASGMAYIRFAREERELFRLLFMRDRSGEAVGEDRASIRPLLALLQQNLGIGEEEAYLLHLEMWIYVHGIATMVATGYLEWDDGFVSRLLTDAYRGLTHRYGGGETG